MENKVCYKLIANCNNTIVQSNGSVECTQCSEGYTPSSDNKGCFAPISFCLDTKYPIVSTETTYCDVCDANHHVDSTHKYCVPAIDNCTAYSKLNVSSKCDSCSEGYILSTDGLECKAQIAGCEEHLSFASGETLKCQSCVDGFDLHFQGRKCSKEIEYCETPYLDLEVLVCLTCKFGTKISADERTCVSSNVLCETFSVNDYSIPVCEQCKNDLILSNDHRICVPPIYKCEQYLNIFYKFDYSRCTKCSVGYELAQDGFACQLTSKTCSSDISHLP